MCSLYYLSLNAVEDSMASKETIYIKLKESLRGLHIMSFCPFLFVIVDVTYNALMRFS